MKCKPSFGHLMQILLTKQIWNEIMKEGDHPLGRPAELRLGHCTKLLTTEQVNISTYRPDSRYRMPQLDEVPTLESIEASPTRCPHPETSDQNGISNTEAKKQEIQLAELLFVDKWSPRWGAPVFDRLS